MRHLVAIVMLYLAFVGHVGIRFGVTGNWTPNLMLLVVLLVAPASIQIPMAAFAGLLFDATSGRPLGVTMLAATLVVTVLWHVRRASPRRTKGGSNFAVVFLAVLAVEASSRLLASSVVNGANRWSEAITSLKIATTTVLVMFLVSAVLVVVKSIWQAVTSGWDRSTTARLASPSPTRR